MSLQAQVDELSFVELPASGEYEVSFDHPSGSSVTGLDYLVVIKFDSNSATPLLTASVLTSNWLFHPVATVVTVSQYSLEAGKVRYSVRTQGGVSPNTYGSGPVMKLQVTEGIVIALEDFPAKRPWPEFSPATGDGCWVSCQEEIRELVLYDLSGKEVLRQVCNQQTEHLFEMPLKTGFIVSVYVLHIRYADGQVSRHKLAW